MTEHKVFSEENEYHAEFNAIIDALKRGENCENASIFCTHSPCFNCSKLIISTGIESVFYLEEYDEKSIKFLKKNGVEVEKIDL